MKQLLRSTDRSFDQTLPPMTETDASTDPDNLRSFRKLSPSEMVHITIYTNDTIRRRKIDIRIGLEEIDDVSDDVIVSIIFYICINRLPEFLRFILLLVYPHCFIDHLLPYGKVT